MLIKSQNVFGMKPQFKVAVLIVGVLALVIGASPFYGDWKMNLNTNADLTLSTLKKIHDWPVYSMEYKNNYGFDEYIQKGGSWSQGDFIKMGCTCFAAFGGESPIFGRNFDFPLNPILVLFTAPKDGHRSVSVVDLGYFGYSMDKKNGADLKQLLYTPFMPFDGMNERGVAIGMMAIPSASYSSTTRAITIGEIQVIRLVLDYADDLDDAIELMSQYNIEFVDPPIHYMVADCSGKSAIVEYINNEMIIIRNSEPWQVSTNFIVTGSEAPDNVDCWRYRNAYNELKDVNGALDAGEAMTLLKEVSQGSTVWSSVYNLKALELYLIPAQKFGEPLEFRLEH